MNESRPGRAWGGAGRGGRANDLTPHAPGSREACIAYCEKLNAPGMKETNESTKKCAASCRETDKAMGGHKDAHRCKQNGSSCPRAHGRPIVPRLAAAETAARSLLQFFLRRNTMRSTLKTMALAGVLAIGGLATVHVPAHAGCGGGGGFRGAGGYGGGHTFNAGSYGGRSGGCGMNGMSMPGMAMPGMNMGGYASAPLAAPVYTPAAYPQAAPQPTAAGAQYTCPMHPTVASVTPGNCPYCHMALQRR